jgi:hypothetical protein
VLAALQALDPGECLPGLGPNPSGQIWSCFASKQHGCNAAGTLHTETAILLHLLLLAATNQHNGTLR